MRVALELITVGDVKNFTELVKTIDYDVRLTGKDENGSEWNISAKSLYGSLILASNAQENKNREHTAHDVDWNTIWCECEVDIYNLIKDYVKNNGLN
jgi:hypothetical protein